MRPIRLKIAGLNSFREAQEIDFSKLCETGVFGIFGSTGSGKSTILDAITLALYGTVERAANNTQGILNYAEEQLTVEYMFSLSTGNQVKSYRAERAYRRSGARTVKASTCRLVEIDSGVETVIASKADDMTKKIEDVLGLTVEDFTRAVVLPQGKFAEFLTIKPKDRRLMLERLFSLEAYGRELSARLVEQMEKAKFTLNGTEQRQQGLGDASEERVKEAEADYKSASLNLDRISKEWTSLKKEYDCAQELWGLQVQLQQIRDKEKELEVKQPNIDKTAERLSLAERAEAVRPILEEVVVTEERFKQAKDQVENAHRRLLTARAEKDTLEGKWAEGNKQRIEAEPRCLRRLEQLEQAKSLENDIRVRDERLNETRHDYGELDRVCKELEQAIQLLNHKKTDMQKQQLGLKSQLLNLSIDPEQRTKVNSAAQALEAYQIVFKQVEGLQKELEIKSAEINDWDLIRQTIVKEVQVAQETVEQITESLNRRQQAPPVREDSMSEQAQELERYRHRIATIERAEQDRAQEQERLGIILENCQQVQAEIEGREDEQSKIWASVQGARSWIETKLAEVKGLEQKNLAGLLVEGLAEGEACPVCGSSHHPKPAQGFDEEVLDKAKSELDQASRELQGLEETLTNGITALAVAKAQLLSKRELEQNQLNLLKHKEQAILSEREELSGPDRHKAVQDLKVQLIEQESKLTNDRLNLNQWKTELEQWERKLEEAQRKQADVEKKQHSTSAQIASVEGLGSGIRNQLNQLLKEQNLRKERLNTLRGEIDLSEILLLQERYTSWDQTTSRLTQELSVLEEGLRETDEAYQRLSQEKTHCELKLQNLKTVGSEAARNLKEIKQKWESLTEGKPAGELIVQVNVELALVIEMEEKLKNSYELANGLWTQAEQTLAVNQKTLEISQEGFEGAQLKLERGLEVAQFPTTTEAYNSLCDLSERIKMDQAISSFQQEVLIWKQKRREVEERLQGQSLRPEEWLAWPIRLQEKEKARNEAIERRGVTQLSLERLNEKHEEWMRLELERKALNHRLSLYKTLQTVFKGNSFVEFIAQEQLTNVAIDASERLKELTNQRYALEVDSEGGFVMRDDANGGVRRPVNSLSGGETFLTALALALALSTQIQLRGESPLEFFFLDEGFGSLDANLLETVMNTLEKLHLQNLTIGIISHVPELKNRLARRLIVTPAEAGGTGSKVQLEMA